MAAEMRRTQKRGNRPQKDGFVISGSDENDSITAPSEEDVKNRIILPWLNQLGVGPNELRFETQFEVTIGTAYRLTVGEQRRPGRKIYADIICYRDDQPLFVIEVKRKDVVLGDHEREQAISYARLLQPKMASFAVVTNGDQTIVYDVVDGQELTTLQDSPYVRNGLQISVGEEIRDVAARAFVSFSTENLLQLCMAQHDIYFAEQTGPLRSGRAYISQVFEPRSEIEERLAAFWSLPFRCFAMLGASGCGKTATLCWIVEKERSRRPIFYYHAKSMVRSLEETLVVDFSWLVGRNQTPEQVLSRLADLSRGQGTELCIVIDGIDEYDDPDRLARELGELGNRVAGRAIRFAVACKLSEWDRFIFQRDALNSLGEVTFDLLPPAAVAGTRLPASRSDKPDRVPGTWLSPFTEETLDRAWERYREAYRVQGVLDGDVRIQCHLPFSMLVVAETFEGAEEVPTDWSAERLLDHWLERRFAAAIRHSPVRRVLGYVANEMVSLDRTIVLEDDLVEVLHRRQVAEPEAALAELLRCGLLLRQSTDDSGVIAAHRVPAITFPHDRLLHHVYTIMAQRWSDLDLGGQLQAILRAGESTRVSRAAAEYYLLAINRGEGPLACTLLGESLAKFARLTGDGKLLSPSQHNAITFLQALLDAYRTLRDVHFRSIANYLDPIDVAVNSIGIVVRRYPSVPGYFRWGFRSKGDYGEPDILVQEAPPDEPFYGSEPQWFGQWIGELGAHKAGYVDLHTIGKILPQHKALQLTLAQVHTLVQEGGRGLDEASNPSLARDRLAHVLRMATETLEQSILAEPYRSEQLLETVSCAELLQEIDLYRFRQQCLRERIMASGAGYLILTPEVMNWANGEARRRIRLGESTPPDRVVGTPDSVIQLEVALRALAQNQSHVGPHPIQVPKGTSLKDRSDFSELDPTEYLEYLREFHLTLVREYRVLVSHNLPSLAHDLASLRDGPVFLRVALVLDDATKEAAPFSSFQVVTQGRWYVLPAASVSVTWCTSPTGNPEVEVLVSPSRKEDEMQLDAESHWVTETPWGRKRVRYRVERFLADYIGDGKLVEHVYELLNEDLEDLFGRDLWHR